MPPTLKPPLVWAWNQAIHRSRTVAEWVGALRHRRFGRCEVCGRLALWLYRRRVVPPRLEQLWGLTPGLAEALARKESLDCSRCGAKLRARRLALALIRTYTFVPAGSLRSARDWARTSEAKELRLAEINRVDGLHDALAPLPNFLPSDYVPGAAPGEVIGGVRSEDLTALTYPDASFDLVVTSESLEHVPNLETALAEVRRVLVPGGRHIFTIPLLPTVPRTFARTSVGPDGADLNHAPEIRHPGGDVGYPVFTEFGLDFPDRLREAGFEVEVMFGPTTENDLAQVYICRKLLQ